MKDGVFCFKINISCFIVLLNCLIDMKNLEIKWSDNTLYQTYKPQIIIHIFLTITPIFNPNFLLERPDSAVKV